MSATLGVIPCPACGDDLELRAGLELHEVSGSIPLTAFVEPHVCLAEDPVIGCKHCSVITRRSACCLFMPNGESS